MFQTLFPVTCGVLQGCPLSGTLFLLAIDPLLAQFEWHILSPGLGAVYACADDVGAALRELKSLRILHRLFSRYRLVSGLTLKPSKCVGIMVSIECTVANV